MNASHRIVVVSALLLAQGALAAAQEPVRARAPVQVRKVDLDSLRMSDPFILADPVTRLYYMTGSGGSMYRSPDLRTWEGPYGVAAPGKLVGLWLQEPQPLNPMNAGHGMLFRTFEGKLLMALHYASLEPGASGARKPMLLEVDDTGDRLRILGRYQPAAGSH